MIDTTHRLTRGRVLGLGVGALLAGAALTAAPAMASTLSTCTYNTSNKNVIVTDNSGSANLRVLTDSGVIRIADGAEAGVTCRAVSLGELARVTNTDRIAIFAAPQHVPGGYMIDQNNGRFAPGLTKETDSDSEIEITLDTTGTSAELTVAGTPQNDVIAVGTGGRINFSYDNDADVVPNTKPARVRVTGGVGNDEIDSNGGGIFSPPADVPVTLEGNAGNDSVVIARPGPCCPPNRATGGFGDDRLFSANGGFDSINGGAGFDTATLDHIDKVEFDSPGPADSVEKKFFLEPVGRLRLTPAVIDARAGEPTRLKVSWTHPKAWKQLRTIRLRVSQGAEDLGTIRLRPKPGNIRGEGAVKVIAGDSKLTHHGKTVTARLAVRLNRSLAGQDLRVEVEATDRNGRKQLEPQAGVIRVAE